MIMRRGGQWNQQAPPKSGLYGQKCAPGLRPDTSNVRRPVARKFKSAIRCTLRHPACRRALRQCRGWFPSMMPR